MLYVGNENGKAYTLAIRGTNNTDVSSIYMSASYEELRKSWKKLEKVMHLSS